MLGYAPVTPNSDLVPRCRSLPLYITTPSTGVPGPLNSLPLEGGTWVPTSTGMAAIPPPDARPVLSLFPQKWDTVSFVIGFDCSSLMQSAPTNMSSVQEHPEIVSQYIAAEVGAGR